MFTPTDNSDQCASELREEAEAGEPGEKKPHSDTKKNTQSPHKMGTRPSNCVALHSFIRSLVFYIDNDGKAQIESIRRH